MSEVRRKACEACRSRKVRCDGGQPCLPCGNVGLQCNYHFTSSYSQSRKAIVRGAVIQKIKQHETLMVEERSEPEQGLPRCLKAPALLTDVIEDYDLYVVPVYPVFTKADLLVAVHASENSLEDEAMVHALAAITINMIGDDVAEKGSKEDRVTALYLQALTLRGTTMPNTSLSASSILISVITSTCLLALHHDVNMGIYYLQEAIAQMETFNLGGWVEDEKSEDREKARLERLYWLLFIHERYVALTYFRPAKMSPLSRLPRADESLPHQVTSGFNQLIMLFTAVDALFVKHWLDKESPTLTVSWIENKQKQLRGIANWDDNLRTLSDFQQVDLIITLCWFRTLVWQMALSKHFLASNAVGQEQALSIFFPIHISHRVRLLLPDMPRQALEIHGPGLLQKIFEIAAVTADILLLVLAPMKDHEQNLLHLENFVVLYRYLISMSRFYHVEKAILNSKFQSLQAIYPSLKDDNCI